jgi:hypothetical protein
MGIVPAFAGGAYLTLGGDRVPQIKLNLGKQEPGLGVLRIGLDGIQQLDLRCLQIALRERQSGIREIICRVSAEWPDRKCGDRQNTKKMPLAHII